MITTEQQQWLDHLSDTETVTIVPWDPTCENKFLQIKKQIQDLLGQLQAVEHRGASSLKISGQDEIDIYIPVLSEEFDRIVNHIANLFGNPRSNYPLKRARFVTSIDGKHIDIFVINQNDNGWIDSEKFNELLLANHSMLDEYRKLKENASGKNVRAYYKEKIEFINKVLSQTKSDK
ncbi:MAG: GrpB family protein [Candidatus Parcubacteria bacterium]|nr:GrpB family protein [Candidatus Parcubacteria bacterium]